MSEKSSEYLKRTCLICGCHTNQTINIYEPRSGPNIVELIQAKFKFQPLNEDKYLCFSCNNWLINWHSLQVLNSNDAESPSGTFRPQINSMFQKEKAENQSQQTQSSQLSSQTNARLRRPTAKVRPWRIIENSHNQIGAEGFILAKHLSPKALKEQNISVGKSKRILKFQRNYRSRILYLKKRRVLLKSVRRRQKFVQCKTSTGYIFALSGQSNKPLYAASLHSLPLLKLKKHETQISSHREQYTEDKFAEIVVHKQKYLETYKAEISSIRTNSNSKVIYELPENAKPSNNNKQCLKRPLVDGKVVSMLRRLGTTLAYENKSTKISTSLFPRIMSPNKPKPQWTRQLDEDEILLDFDSAISEVLPQVIHKQQQKSSGDKCVPEVMASMQAKRKLMYQVSSIGKDKSQCIYPTLPEGLCISLV